MDTQVINLEPNSPQFQILTNPQLLIPWLAWNQALKSMYYILLANDLL